MLRLNYNYSYVIVIVIESSITITIIIDPRSASNVMTVIHWLLETCYPHWLVHRVIISNNAVCRVGSFPSLFVCYEHCSLLSSLVSKLPIYGHVLPVRETTTSSIATQ